MVPARKALEPVEDGPVCYSGRVSARTASETIAEQIRSQIATGELRPGDMLPSESALLDLYAVARPTMRGALRILESDGLVSIERGVRGGARVTEPDLAPLARRVGLHLQLRGTDVEELIEAQAAIQPGVVALAASARDTEDVARLRAEVVRFGSATTVEDFLEAVAAFTRALLHAAHNAALTLYAELTGELLREGLDAFVHEQGIELEQIEDAVSRSARQFAALVDRIEAGDADGAEALWREYLRLSGASPATARSPLRVSRRHRAGA